MVVEGSYHLLQHRLFYNADSSFACFWKFGESSEKVQTFLLLNIYEQEEYLSSLGGD
jgi:hypothetical protein